MCGFGGPVCFLGFSWRVSGEPQLHGGAWGSRWLLQGQLQSMYARFTLNFSTVYKKRRDTWESRSLACGKLVSRDHFYKRTERFQVTTSSYRNRVTGCAMLLSTYGSAGIATNGDYKQHMHAVCILLAWLPSSHAGDIVSANLVLA